MTSRPSRSRAWRSSSRPARRFRKSSIGCASASRTERPDPTVLPLEHVRPGDLVQPALLPRVERHPDDANEADEERDEKAQPSQQRLAEADLLTGVGVNDSQLEDPLAQRAALVGPHVTEIADVDHELKKAGECVGTG